MTKYEKLENKKNSLDWKITALQRGNSKFVLNFDTSLSVFWSDLECNMFSYTIYDRNDQFDTKYLKKGEDGVVLENGLFIITEKSSNNLYTHYIFDGKKILDKLRKLEIKKDKIQTKMSILEAKGKD